MHPFRAYISMFSEFTDEDWAKVQACLTFKVYQANRLILIPGTICNWLFFLENGSVRHFEPAANEYKTLNRIKAPFIFTSARSFAEQVPSTEGIQALDEARIWIMTKDDAYKLMEVPSWQKFIISTSK